MRGGVGVEKQDLKIMAESKPPQAFASLLFKNHPRTLPRKSFSNFDSTQPTLFMLKFTHPRNCTLKTRYNKPFRHLLLQFLLLPNRDWNELSRNLPTVPINYNFSYSLIGIETCEIFLDKLNHSLQFLLLPNRDWNLSSILIKVSARYYNFSYSLIGIETIVVNQGIKLVAITISLTP